MKKTLTAYFVTFATMLAADFIWLSLMNGFYRSVLGDMMLDGFRPAPAILFYLVYIGGLVYFAVLPALSGGGWLKAGINGAVLGCVAYATYDLTNQATLRNWSTALTLTDLAWGTCLSAFAASVGYRVTRAICGDR